MSGGCPLEFDATETVADDMNLLEGGRKRRHLPDAAFLWQLAVCIAGAIAATWLVLHV